MILIIAKIFEDLTYLSFSKAFTCYVSSLQYPITSLNLKNTKEWVERLYNAKNERESF